MTSCAIRCAQQKTELGVTYTTRYTYDAADRVVAITYPDGRTVTYTRDPLGRIERVSATVNDSAQPIVSERTYRADGLLKTQTYGNSLKEVRDHDLRGRLTYQSLGTADTRVYTYDPNGNLTQQQTLPDVATYAYDPLDRLTEETADGEHNTYTYDPNGNRLSILGRRGRPSAYTYAPQTNRLLQTGRDAITLDPAGYTLSDNDGKRRYTWNAAGRLQEFKHRHAPSTRYTYNYLGQRTRKARREGTTVYHYDLSGQLIAETDRAGKLIRAYLWAAEEPIAQIERHPRHRPAQGYGRWNRQAWEELLYLHADHLQTPRLATDAAQRVVWRFESDAFGREKSEPGRHDEHERAEVRLRFAGQYYDEESELYYNWHRYYDPRTGRYLSSDPIGLAGGLNTYTYVDNGPLRFVDPSGLFILSGEAVSTSLHYLKCNDSRDILIDAISAALTIFDLALGGPTGEGIAPAMVLQTLKQGAKSFTKNQLRKFEKQLAQHGRGSLEKSLRTLERRLSQHQQDLKKYKDAGGYTSSVEREIRNFNQEIAAIKEILRR